MKNILSLLAVLLFAPLTALHAADTPSSSPPKQPNLEPLLCRRGELIFSDTFDGLMKPQWKAQMATRWAIKDGVLRGEPATPENQAGKTLHTGRTPAITLEVPVRDAIVQVSFKVSGSNVAANFGFNNGTWIDGTGHVCNLNFDIRTGVQIVKRANAKLAGDTDEVLATSDWKAKRDQWYGVMLETRGEEFVAQVFGGPTLIARHPRIAIDKSWLNLQSRGVGTIAFDDVSIWKGEPNPQWEATRARLTPKEKR